MHAVLFFERGRRVDALLLSASSDVLRVVVPGRGDTIELRMIGGRWTSDRGQTVEIGALIAAEGMPAAHFLPQRQTRTFAAV